MPIQGGVVEKRFWPVGDMSPWAEDDERPTPLQAARWYPERLLGVFILALLSGIFISGFVLLVLNLLLHTVLGAAPFGIGSVCVGWLILTPGLAWLELYGEIRGWWTWHYDT